MIVRAEKPLAVTTLFHILSFFLFIFVNHVTFLLSEARVQSAA